MADERRDPAPHDADETPPVDAPPHTTEPVADDGASTTRTDATDTASATDTNESKPDYGSMGYPEVVEAEIVETETVVVDEPEDRTDATETAPAAPAGAEATSASTATPQVVYVQTPLPPKKAGNRGVGTLLALLATLVFAIVLALGTLVLGLVTGEQASVAFLANIKFWLPVIVFGIAFILLVLVVNRASWWAYILGSLVVAAAVYFGTIGLGSLIDWLVLRETTTFADAALSPFVILATLLAREVAMWFGAAIARRGRRVKERNAEARAAFDRELAEHRARYSNAT